MKYFLQLLFVLLICSNSYAQNIEIIYVNANIGAAAGGHVALKLDHDVFHYQFYPDERFLLVRESWETFSFIYNRLRNRTIYSAVCPISEEAYQRIRTHFTTILATQRRDFSLLDSLLERKEMIDTSQEGRIALSVKGLGFFVQGQESSRASRTVRSHVDARLGSTFLEQNQELLLQDLTTIQKVIAAEKLRGKELLAKIQIAADLKKKHEAYTLINSARSLQRDSLVGGSIASLSPDALSNLEQILHRRLQVLTNLLVSERADVGRAIILEFARCQSLIEAMSTHTLLTLDPYPDDAVAKQVEHYDREMQYYLETLQARLEQQTILLLEKGLGQNGAEIDYRYLQLENIHSRLSEVGDFLTDHAGIRIVSNLMLPSRSRSVQLNVSEISVEEVTKLSKLLEEEAITIKERNEDKYRYQLIKRNCVNLLLTGINDSFSSSKQVAEELGGFIDPIKDRVVVPHDFFFKVKNTYRTLRVDRYPSRRIAGVETLERYQDSFDVWLQEGNTIRSTIYKKRSADTPFLFFTDDISLARPALGLANVIWGVAHGIGGITQLPVDGGVSLQQAFRGIFYSLPELLFFNIRKGTYLYDAVHVGGHEL